MTNFPLQRAELDEARQLIQTLVATEGISSIQFGALYDESPDKVRYGRDRPDSPFELLGATPLKDVKNKEMLERVRAVARRISCQDVSVDEFNQVWVVMYAARNYDYGYVSFGPRDTKVPTDRDYIKIPGEERWFVYRR
ncbi:MAG: hypothetical protein ABI988_18505 [Nitrospirota bacterium]